MSRKPVYDPPDRVGVEEGHGRVGDAVQELPEMTHL